MTDLLIRTVPRAPKRSVLICDDRPTARKALAHLLTPCTGARAVRAVADGVALVDALAACPTELVLIGLRRGKPTGPTAVDLLLTLTSSATVIVYGTSADTDLLTAAITRGAGGLMLWDPDQRLPAQPVTSPMPRDAAHSSGGTVALTDRELQILLGMSMGRSNSEIGRQLFLSEDTIKTHTRRLFARLDARDRAQAVARGLQAGLIR